jgi:hypothetical protein
MTHIIKCGCGGDIFLMNGADSEPRRLNGKPVCDDCFFGAMGDMMEEHPPGINRFALSEKSEQEIRKDERNKVIKKIIKLLKSKEYHGLMIEVDFSAAISVIEKELNSSKR